jgi:hypothetical protein
MTLSPDTRRRNLDEALVSFLDALGDEWFCTFYISPPDFPNVLETTWPELIRRRLLKDTNMNEEMYLFTPLGYVTALKVSGRSDDPQFRAKLGNLCKVLKDSLKGRSDFAWVPFDTLVVESGVSKEFAYNALDADLIRNVLERIGAAWEGEHLVRVPNDFGLPI